MTKDYTSLKITNTIAFVAMVVINILANAIPLGGLTTGQISAMYPTIVTPPGFTFAIWGVIYALLGVFVIAQFFYRYDDEAEAVIIRIGPFFILSCVSNILWIIFWHAGLIVPATIAIFALMACLLRIYMKTRGSSFISRISFSVYYAWITIACLISAFVLVKTLTGNAPVTPIQPRGYASIVTSMSPGDYTDIILIAGNPEIASYVSIFEYVMSIVAMFGVTFLTIWHYLRHEDLSYVITIMWAVGGIAFRQITSTTPPILMLLAAFIGVTIIVLVVVKHMIDKRTYKRYRRRTV